MDPAVRVILWLDFVVLMAAGFALAGKPLALGLDVDADPWTWLALAGSALTAVLAALAAFHLSTPSPSHVWLQLPAPAVVLWIAGSLGSLAMPADASALPAGCLGFLLGTGLPLFAVTAFMLRRAARQARSRALMMGALASAGAAASLLTLVHPHPVTVPDLVAHAAALAVVLGIAAAASFGRSRA